MEENSLEKLIIKHGVNRVLVVDDTKENIAAAKQYFKGLEQIGIVADYALSAKEAKEKIKSAHDVNNKYCLILSDLEMEESNSGIEVAKEAYRHLGFGFIVTGRGYDKIAEIHGHGPATLVYPSKDLNYCSSMLNGKKDNPVIWEGIFKLALEYLDSPMAERTINAVRRYERYHDGECLPIEIVDLLMVAIRFSSGLDCS